MPYNSKEKQKAYQKARHASMTAEQKEALRIKSREYYRSKRNDPVFKEASRISAQKYRDKDPMRARVSVHQHGVRRRNPEAAASSDFDDLWLHGWLLENYGKPCPYCGMPNHHIDHKIPLTRGGSHTKDNLALIYEDCNRMKRDKTPEEFLEHVHRIATHTH